jgi:hypothetical protein
MGKNELLLKYLLNDCFEIQTGMLPCKKQLGIYIDFSLV